jgi:Icc-related predicted phosphoesterase
MKVSVISDLHLEFSDLTLPGGDVLILSGDAMEAKHFNKENYDPEMVLLEHENPAQRPDRFYRFMEEECSKKYREVIYVMGNHEHYGFQLQKTYDQLKSQLPSNVHLLENETYKIDDVTFVGCTLWTDMNKRDPITMWECSQMMNDYRTIKILNEAKSVYHKLTPDYTATLHEKSKAYIREQLEADPAGKFVVVTHHSPSKLSTKPQYEDDVHMNGAYSSDLSEFILEFPQIKVWTHGHTHHPFDYTIGETRIICNPRGYKNYEHQADVFDPTYGFEL